MSEEALEPETSSDYTVLDKIKKDLIGTGIFLERDVYEQLKSGDRSIKVHREYPYSYGVHPVIINGAVDILAAVSLFDYSHLERVLVLSIECKKADPKLKHWVFEPDRSELLKETPEFLYLKKQDPHYAHQFNLPALGYRQPNDFERCVNVFEFNQNDGKISRQAEKSFRAYYAVKQSNESIPGIVEIMPSISPGLAVPNVVIPLVVTTGNLWVTSYDAKDIDRASGEIDPAKLGLEPKKWVLYDYPLPFAERVTGDVKGNQYTPLKRSTFVVQAEAFPSFLENLKSDFQSYFMEDTDQ